MKKILLAATILLAGVATTTIGIMSHKNSASYQKSNSLSISYNDLKTQGEKFITANDTMQYENTTQKVMNIQWADTRQTYTRWGAELLFWGQVLNPNSVLTRVQSVVYVWGVGGEAPFSTNFSQPWTQHNIIFSDSEAESILSSYIYDRIPSLYVKSTYKVTSFMLLPIDENTGKMVWALSADVNNSYWQVYTNSSTIDLSGHIVYGNWIWD